MYPEALDQQAHIDISCALLYLARHESDEDTKYVVASPIVPSVGAVREFHPPSPSRASESHTVHPRYVAERTVIQ